MFILIYFLVYKSSVTPEVLNTLVILDFILIGGIIPLFERKYLSLIQRRVGPKINGFSGKLQFILDALKVFFKEYFYLFKISKVSFFILPILFFNLSIIIVYNINWYNFFFIFDMELNIVFLLITSTVANWLVHLVGYLSRNKYSIISSTRVINIFFTNEILISIIICQFFYFSNSFSFVNYTIIKKYTLGFLLWLPYIPVFIFIFLLEVNKGCFDYVECESELVMGYMNEYTGFLFGIFILIEYVHLYFFIFFFVKLMI